MIGVQASRRAKTRLVYAENCAAESTLHGARRIVMDRDLASPPGSYRYARLGNRRAGHAGARAGLHRPDAICATISDNNTVKK